MRSARARSAWLAPVMLIGLAACRDRGAPSPTGPPADPGDASFVGQQVCSSCHTREAALWLGSHHQKAMQPADNTTVLGNFRGSTVIHGGRASTFSSQDGRFTARTDGPDGKPAEYEIAYTFGVAPLQQYLVRFPRGRYQALSIAWDSRPEAEAGQRWFPLYPDENIDHRDVLHWTGPAQNWNFMCAECHSTNVRKNYSVAEDRYETTWSEINVSCEACHGPGSRHVDWGRAAGDGNGDGGSDRAKGLVFSLKEARGAWVIPPGKAIATRLTPVSSRVEVETCGRCHSRRSQIWPDYVFGRPLAETHAVAFLDEGLYEPDGQQHDEVYEYGSFLQSRMYAAGVTCSNCHDPHSSRLRLTGNAVCTQCHAPTTYDDRSHHFHAQGTESAQCVSCHMPARNYMVIDARRDHGFRVPRPDESVSAGTPNACMACHGERGSKWAAAAVAKWYGPQAARRRSFTEALASGRERRAAAPALLAGVADDATLSGIVRGTAITLLGRFPGATSAGAVSRAANDSDPMVRRAAASALPAIEPGMRARVGAALLSDPIRTVRMEAVLPTAALSAALLAGESRRAFERAAAEFRLVQLFNADRAEANVNLGALEAQLGRPDQAEAAYRTAIRLQPRFTPAYVALADVQRARGRELDVEQTLRQALTIAPDAADVHNALGLALVRQKRMPAALPALARAAQLAPSEPRFAYVYAVALHDTGDVDGAFRTLEGAVGRHPTDRDILQALVSYSAQSGNFQKAHAWAQRVAEIAPDDPSATRQLEQLRTLSARP